MDVIITVERVLETQSFPSKKEQGKVFKKFSFVGKTQDQYPKKICFSCMNEDTWNKAALKEGSMYQVFFDVSSREWNGKWFTEATCWKIQPPTQIGNQQTVNTVQGQQNNDDIPF